MARRAGKAATRKARQRYQPRTPRPTPAPAPEEATTSEAADTSRTVSTPEPPRRSPSSVAYSSGGSTLTARERAEYHYVERDLRNIGILTLVMVIVLVAAWFVFNGLGLV
jgi:hypothetical protein